MTPNAKTPEGAQRIATNGSEHSPTVRALAWRTLKNARGQTMNSQRILCATLGFVHGRAAQ
jgi:hypothetical protein